MATQVLPPDSRRASIYKRQPFSTTKVLQPDGSVWDESGVQVLPPDSKRARAYDRAPFSARKFLLPDGSVVDRPNDGGTVGGDVTLAEVIVRDEQVLDSAKAYTDSMTAPAVAGSPGQTMSGVCKFIAHRGMSGLAPENTIPAYRLASLRGFWGVEADIQMTSEYA